MTFWLTVAGMLAGRLGWDFQEGDDLHPEANVAKMASGHALNDDDRWPWLDRVAAWIDGQIAAGRPGVITCSALKRSYRDVLRRDDVTFVLLMGDPALVLERLLRRQGHYMPPSLLTSPPPKFTSNTRRFSGENFNPSSVQSDIGASSAKSDSST